VGKALEGYKPDGTQPNVRAIIYITLDENALNIIPGPSLGNSSK
jgi:hypothetical protein